MTRLPPFRRARSRRIKQRALLLLLVLAALSVAAPAAWAQAPVDPVSPAALPDGLVIEPLITVGEDGFTGVSAPPDGGPGKVVFGAVRNDVNGIWLLEGSTLIEVVRVGAVLPNGLGTVNVAVGPRLAPNGDVIFIANVSGGSLPAGSHPFRWRSGTIIRAAPTGANFTHVLNKPNRGSPASDGRWLAFEVTGASPRQTRHYVLTDGETVTPLGTLTDTTVDGTGPSGYVGPCSRTERRLHAVNAVGVYAYSEFTYEIASCAPNPINFPNPVSWTIKLGGAVEATLLSGSYIVPIATGMNGVQPRFDDAILSDANELVFQRVTRNPGPPIVETREVVAVAPGSTPRVLFPVPGPNGTTLFGLITSLDAQGRFAGVGALNTPGRMLLKGNNPINDVLLKEGDTLFGQTLLALQPDPSVHHIPGGQGENRVFIFNYLLQDGTVGIARIGKPAPRWANPGGGAWGTAANWSTAAVPLQTNDVTFPIGASYNVQVGTHRIGSVAVEQGNVRFVNASLEVSTAGALAVVGSANGPVPRLTIGQGRAVAGTGEFDSGVAANVTVGPGEFVLTNAGVIARATAGVPAFGELGVLGPATATVTGGASWSVQSLMVGTTAPALLRVEDGGWIRSLSEELLIDEVWIGGSAGSSGTANQPAAVRVDGSSGNAGPHGLGASIAVVERLVVGQKRPGNLDIVGGGSVFAVTTTVGTRDHGALVDGALTVDGINTAQPSQLSAGRNIANDGGLFVATADGTRAEVSILNGGQVTATELLLAAAPQSSALMFVDGLEPTDVVDQSTGRSALYAPFPTRTGIPQQVNPSAGTCVIGYLGRGTLNVSNGGLVQCHQVVVGFGANSRGEMNIGGAFATIRPTVAAVGAASFEDALVTGRGIVCIGRVARCGATAGTVRGDVALGADGVLEAVIVVVGPGGRILGNGVVIASGTMSVNGGTLAPGVFVADAPAAAEAEHTEENEAALAPSAGTLTIEGNLTLSSTSVISIEVLGPASAQQDRIVVSGTATLAGTLLVQFANGYVPTEGDQFAFIQAGSTRGSFGTVTVSGLPPAFKFGVVNANGVLTLTVTDDGIPNSAPQVKVYVPVVRVK